MSAQCLPRENQLLEVLPESVFCRWLPWLEIEELPLGRILYEPGTTMNYVYFDNSDRIAAIRNGRW